MQPKIFNSLGYFKLLKQKQKLKKKYVLKDSTNPDQVC